MSNMLIADSDRLRSYAKRIEIQKNKLVNMDRRLQLIKVDIQTSAEEKKKARNIGNLKNGIYQLEQCSQFLKTAANEIEVLETSLAKMNALDFKKQEVQGWMQHLANRFSPLIENIKFEEVFDGLWEVVDQLNPELKTSVQGFLTIAEYLEQPNKLLEDGFEKVLGGLKDYLDASATGMLDGLGIDAFMNMVKRYPDAFISAQNVIKGREDDLDAWMEYAWYFGEHVFVDGILETAASQINGIFENDLFDIAATIGECFFGVDLDLSIDHAYEKQFGVGGVEGYKKGLGELYSTLSDYASENYFKDADSFMDVAGGTVELIGDGVSYYVGWFNGLFGN